MNVLRILAASGEIRGFFMDGKEMVASARAIHNTSPTATAALGRLLMGSAMMGLMLKNDSDLLSVQFQGDGPLGGMLATANSRGMVKGYAVNPQADLPPKYPGKLNVGALVGSGRLTVTKRQGEGAHYVSSIELVSGEVAEDLTAYFAQSEQLPTCVSLGVLVDKDTSVARAGGFILQLMPGHSQNTLNRLEKIIENCAPITTLLGDMNIEELAMSIMNDFGIDEITRQQAEYHCDCSRERMEEALLSLDKVEIDRLIEEDGRAELLCHFCNSAYEFSGAELSVLSGRKLKKE